MKVRAKLPPGLPADTARPLLEVAERIRVLEPWKKMSDLHLIGLRDDSTGELQIASVLGTLGTLFAVIIYRHEAGLRGIYELANSAGAESDPDASLEALDYFKVEWTRKGELTSTDFETLSAGAFKPKGKGHIWPRFQSSAPGWFPWYPSVLEANLLTEQLKKVLRLLRLLQRVPDLFAGHSTAEVPIIVAGDETSLTEETIEWHPLVLGPEPKPDLITLSVEEEAKLAKLPTRKDFVFEFAAPLMPEMSFWDDIAGRPCLARTCVMIDRHSHFIFETKLANGSAPLHVSLKPVLVEGLLKAKVRPGEIHVSKASHATVLQNACRQLGISVVVADRLESAEDALRYLVERFQPGH